MVLPGLKNLWVNHSWDSGAALADVKVWKLQILVWNLALYSPVYRSTLSERGDGYQGFPSGLWEGWHCSTAPAGGLINQVGQGLINLLAEQDELWDRPAGISSSCMVREKQHLLNHRLGIVKNLMVNLAKHFEVETNPRQTTSNLHKSFFFFLNPISYTYTIKIFGIFFLRLEKSRHCPQSRVAESPAGCISGWGKKVTSRENTDKTHLPLARAGYTLLHKQRPCSKEKRRQLQIQKKALERYIYHSNYLEYT